MSNNLKAKVKDWLLEIGGFVRMQTSKNPPDHYLGYVLKNKVPVVLIPGIFNKWGFYKPLTDSISLAGYPVYVVSKLGHNMKDIPTCAGIVKDLIEKENLTNVVILSHSKGGLVGKYILKNLNYDERVIKLIAISTPFLGSTLVKHMIYKRFTDFSPDSLIVKELGSDTKDNSKIVTLSSSLDVIIRPHSSAKLEGANNISLKATGHNSAVNSMEASSIIVALLDQISKDRL